MSKKLHLISSLVWNDTLSAPMHAALSKHFGVTYVVLDKGARLTAVHGDTSDIDGALGDCYIGQPVAELFCDYPEHVEAYHAALRGESTQANILINNVLYETRIFPLLDTAQSIVGAMGIATDITEKMQEDKLRLDSHQLNNFLDNAHDGIFIVNREYVIQRANPRISDFSMVPDIVGTVCYKIFFDIDGPCSFCPVAETFRTNKPATSSCYHQTLRQHLALSSAPLFDMESGEIIGAFETCRDVTDLVMYQQALKSYEHGQLMLDAIPLCCALLDEHFEVVDCNEAAIKLFECKTKRATCEFMLQMLPECQPDGYLSEELLEGALHQAYIQGNTRDEWVFRLPSGELMPAEVTFQRLESQGENLMAMYIRDLRREKAMSAAVEESNERIRAMFDGTPLGCLLVSMDLHTVDCNQEMLRIVGANSVDELPTNFLNLSPELQPCGRSSREMAIEYVKEASIHGYRRFEWQHSTVQGIPVPVEVTIVRVTLRDQPFMAGYIRDLREIKKMEAELERERAELVLAKEVAESASQTKSRFLANMSHEIRTPMNAILGLSYIAIKNNPPEEQRSLFEKIHTAATNLLGIINDILDFSKIEARKLTLESAPFSLPEQLRNMLEILTYRAADRHIDLSEQYVPEILRLGPVVGDAARLRQVLVNLIGNAVKFTERGGVLFEVDIVERRDNHVLISFSVHDTGIGIAEDVLSTLFQPFSQADGSITRRFGGTGLGLVISRELVELMGGEMTVESIPGYGSSFVCTLPFGLACVEPVETTPDRHFQDDKERLHGIRVLLVEDNTINQMIAQNILEGVGVIVEVADNGQEALDWLADHNVDAVLMDIQMPVLDGLEATRRLRAKGFKLPIIAMTAHAMSDDHTKSLNAGMNAHVTKPIDPDALFATLAQFAKRPNEPSAQ